MKILILYHNTLGGSSVVAYQQGIGMSELFGIEVHFLGWAPPFSMDLQEIQQKEKVFFHQVQVKKYASLSKSITDLFLISQLVDLVRQYKIDLIHCHYAVPFSLCAVIAKEISKSSVKIISTVHGTDVIGIGKTSSLYHTTQYGLSQSDAITAVSQNLKRHSLENFNLLPEKIEVISNFIYKKQQKQNINFSRTNKEQFVIIHISNLRTIKNPIGVLSIFQEFKKIQKNCVLWIVGDGPCKSTLQKKTKLWNLENSVKFHGTVKNIIKLLEQADICLISSLYESFCLVALESAYCGVTVIAPHVGGIPEIAQYATKSILLYEEGNTQQAVSMLQDVCENVDSYKKEAVANQAKLESVFAKEIVLQKYFSLYERILTTKK